MSNSIWWFGLGSFIQKKPKTPPKWNHDESLSIKIKVASSPLSHRISSKISWSNNSRERHYTQKITTKCVEEEDNSTKSEKTARKRKKSEWTLSKYKSNFIDNALRNVQEIHILLQNKALINAPSVVLAPSMLSKMTYDASIDLSAALLQSQNAIKLVLERIIQETFFPKLKFIKKEIDLLFNVNEKQKSVVLF